jgi:hypothetical protein
MNGHNRSSNQGPPRAPHAKVEPVAEDTLRSSKVQIERKTFLFSLKENPRGRFLRITEDVGGRRDMIIVPASGLGEFIRVLDEMAKASEGVPTAETESSSPQQP